MEDYNVSKRIDVTNQVPAASWSRMAACPANWPGPLCRHNGCIVPDRQPQPVPDGHPDWELSGASRLCRIPVRPPAHQLALSRHGCDEFLHRWHPGCAWGIHNRIPIASRPIEPHSWSVSEWRNGCWTDRGGMQDRGSGLAGAADTSHLADGRAAVGRSCWYGICSPGKHWLCLYGVAAQSWFYQCFDNRDSDPRPVRAVWPRGLDRHSWCCVVPRECAKSLSHYPSRDPDLPLRLCLAWSLGWDAIHRVRCCPAGHSYLDNIADTRHNRHCHPLCLVSAGDDPANAAASIGTSIGLSSVKQLPCNRFQSNKSTNDISTWVELEISAANNEVLPVWPLHLSGML